MRTICLIILSLYSCYPLWGQEVSAIRMSDSINTHAEEYWPTISADGSTMIFNRLNTESDYENENFFYSTLDSLGNWSKALPLKNLNTTENEGASTISADGRFIIFTSCNQRGSYGSCDLYYSFKLGNRWLPAQNIGPSINTKAWETQPSLSADGTELYFVSNREGGKGGMDIWHSRLIKIDDKGRMHWTQPTNLNINTPKDEIAPFIHSDNKTLYFSSNAYTVEPQFDIYISRKEQDSFSNPKNIGAPINTDGDEVGFVVNTTGTTAYFASNKHNENRDIYSFNLPQEVQPSKVQILKGKVQDITNGKPLFATLSLHSQDDSKTLYNTLTDTQNGDYLACLAANKKWHLSVQSQGYLLHSEILESEDSPQTEILKDIQLKPIKKGAKISLQSILFDTDKATLKHSSKTTLQAIKELLLQNPSLKIEISGHTDNQGGTEHNQKLSEARAQAVYTWLVSEDISKERLTFRGYGESLPISTNETEQGRSQNRRTELKVTAY